MKKKSVRNRNILILTLAIIIIILLVLLTSMQIAPYFMRVFP